MLVYLLVVIKHLLSLFLPAVFVRELEHFNELEKHKKDKPRSLQRFKAQQAIAARLLSFRLGHVVRTAALLMFIMSLTLCSIVMKDFSPGVLEWYRVPAKPGQCIGHTHAPVECMCHQYLSVTCMHKNVVSSMLV